MTPQFWFSVLLASPTLAVTCLWAWEKGVRDARRAGFSRFLMERFFEWVGRQVS